MMGIELAEYKYIHFIGIGGISMSGLAEILHSKGYVVSGSDAKSSQLTEHLEMLGIKVTIGQSEANITNEIDLVVYTAAVKGDNPEIIQAGKMGIKSVDRADLLGSIMYGYEKPVCISGTHGKTTTTSMVADIFLKAEKDPTITIGGILPSIHSNVYAGGKEYFLAESCEYFDSFLKFYPYVGIILNVDFDHLDYFKDMEHVIRSYTAFAKNISENGFLIINNEIEYVPQIIKELKCKIITYGNNGDYSAQNISYENGCGRFSCVYKGEVFAKVALSVPGDHNISNALAAIAAARTMGIEPELITEALFEYSGTERRFQTKGRFKGVTVVDDYAHHPTEIKATLSAARNSNYKNIWCVFQPHTYTRTKHLLTEISKAFELADNVIILDIYAAREADTGEIDSKKLVSEIQKEGKDVIYCASFGSAAEYLSNKCQDGDLLITMGAGDVYLLGEQILEKFYPHYPQKCCV